MITIKHIDGVGVNGRYAVYRDNIHVASLRRTGSRSFFGIYSVHYGEKLGSYSNINAARAAALELAYPDDQQVYETICQRIEKMRRQYYRTNYANDLADAARDLASGSNSAQQRLIDLSNEIETLAMDRSKVKPGYYENGKYIYSNEPVYPEPPHEILGQSGAA